MLRAMAAVRSLPCRTSHRTLTRAGRSASARRAHALQYISAALQKLAATRNVAVVVLTQCATRFRAEQGVTLISAVNSGAWDQGVSTRLVLFRDWVWKDSRAISVRLAGVQKLNGKPVSLPDNVVAFDIDSVRVLPGLAGLALVRDSYADVGCRKD